MRAVLTYLRGPLSRLPPEGLPVVEGYPACPLFIFEFPFALIFNRPGVDFAHIL